MIAKYKSEKIRKAAKAHTCTDCGSPIQVGTEYLEMKYPIVRGGSPEYTPTDRWCEGCAGKRGLLAVTFDAELSGRTERESIKAGELKHVTEVEVRQ